MSCGVWKGTKEQTESVLGTSAVQAEVHLRSGERLYATVVRPLARDVAGVGLQPWGCLVVLDVALRDVAFATVASEPFREQRRIARAQREKYDHAARQADRWERVR
jgi:hypothetical protein